MFIRWGNPCSTKFRVTNGVKQGGILQGRQAGGVSTPPEFWMGGVEHLSNPPDFEGKKFRGGWLPLN